MNSRKRVTRIAACAICLIAPAIAARAAQVDATWNGGVGTWNTAALWTPNVVPNNGAGGNTYHVRIDNGNAAASTVNLDIVPTIDRLTVTAGDTLALPSFSSVTMAVGPITNDGVISLNSTGGFSILQLQASMSLTGGGVLGMSNNINNGIQAQGGNWTLTHDAAHTIRGAGKLGNNSLNLINHGLIDANQPAGLEVNFADGTGPSSNDGIMQASGGGLMSIIGSSILDNTDGLIQALTGSVITLNSCQINGGELHTEGTGEIRPSGAAEMRDFTLTGLIRHASFTSGSYGGAVQNNGTISLESTGGFSIASMGLGANPTTFSGTGQIVLSNNVNNTIQYTNIAGASRDLVNGATHTIRGAGRLGNNSLNLVNHGLVDGNQPLGLELDFADGLGLSSNDGIIQSSGSGLLSIALSTVDNTGGVIQAIDTSTLTLQQAEIIGGVLHTTGTAAIRASQTSSLRDFTLTGLLRQQGGDIAIYGGTVTNNGTISLETTGAGAIMRLLAGPVLFTGNGAIVMSNNAVNQIVHNFGAAGTVTNGANHTIRGAGLIGLDARTLVNDGLIDANQPAGLTFNTTGGGNLNLNPGVIQASGGGQTTFNNVDFDNSSGVIQALAGSKITVTNSDITGGVFHTEGNGFIKPTNFSDLRNFTLTGLIRHENGDRAQYHGTITNNGTISVESTGAFTAVGIPGTTTFAGNGQIVLGGNVSSNVIGYNSVFALINGPSHTIRGGGSVDALAITNQGAIIADHALRLFINNNPNVFAGTTNTGLMAATGAGGMKIAGGPFTTSGTVNIAAGSGLERTGNYNQTGGITTVNGGLGASDFVFINGGVIKGDGTINGQQLLVAHGGTIAPGDPIGSLGVITDFSSSGVIAIEIGGLTAGTQYDQLLINRVLGISGTLSISFVNGFDPQVGDSFQVITYAFAVPPPQEFPVRFDNFVVPCNLPGRAVQVDVNTFGVIVRIIAGGDLLDVNCDCVYSLSNEIGAFIKALINPAAFTAQYPGCPLTNADFNNDGLVDGRDVQPFVNVILN